MADSTASLGIAVDSAEASKNLRDFAEIVKRAGDAATKFEANLSSLNRGLGSLPNGLKNAANEANNHANQMERTATSTQKASVAATILTRSLQGMVAALAGGALYKAIELSVNKLAELGDRASDTRLGKDFLQGLRIGAADARVSTADLNKALDAFTEVSKQAVPQAKEFYKALSNIGPAFAQAFKDQAGKAGGQEERLKIIADALKNARTETQRYQLAQKALGTDNDGVIDMFIRGRQALDEYVAKAREYGIIVDDAYIKKAQEAQRSLGTLAAVIADKLRMAIVDLLPSMKAAVPLLETMATKVGDFLAGYLNIKDRPEGTLERQLQSDREELGRLEKQLSNVDMWDKWTGGADDLRKRIAGLKKEIEEIPGILLDKHMSGLKPPPANDNKPAGFAARPSLGDNAFDRQTESIRKQIAVMQADAEAVGKTVGEHAKLRVEAQLLEAGLKAGLTPETIRASQQYQKLGQSAADAAQALAKARINDNIKFDRNTSFLSQEDVQIAQQLRGLYPSVAEALSSVEANAMRANNAMRELSSLGQDVNRGLLVEFGQQLRNGASAWDAFRNAGVNALGKIADKLMQMAADNLWKSAFGGASGSFFGGLGSLFGLGGSGGVGSVGVVGAAGGMVVPTFFHGGGVVGSAGTQRGAFPLSLFDAAPRYHLGVDEVPAILQRGERVIPRGQNDNRAGSTVNVSMPISVDASGSEPGDIAKAVRAYVNSPDFDAKVSASVIGARKRNVKI